MDFYRENKAVLQNLFLIKSQTTEMKTQYKNDFALLMIVTVRHKIFSNIIKIFKFLRYDKIIECWNLLPRIYKQIRIHKYQLKKTEEHNSYLVNVKYFDDLINVILRQLLFYKK